MRPLDPDKISEALMKNGYSIRDHDTFSSCVKGAYQTVGGVEMNPTAVEKAAHIFYNIVRQHPLVDGNKRTGVILCNMLLYKEGHPATLSVTDKQWIHIVTNTAQGSYSKQDIVEHLKNWTCQ